MNISETCCCGSVFSSESADRRSNVAVQDAHRDWMDAHAPCREANVIKMAAELNDKG